MGSHDAADEAATVTKDGPSHPAYVGEGAENRLRIDLSTIHSVLPRALILAARRFAEESLADTYVVVGLPGYQNIMVYSIVTPNVRNGHVRIRHAHDRCTGSRCCR